MACPTFNVDVIGGGLAGCEAAWQLASRGVKVRLFEMRPQKMTPAHETGLLGEMVCSNSFGGDKPVTPAGILKKELRLLGSFMMLCAEKCRVPAGNALAVDRQKFAFLIDKTIRKHPNIEIIRQEILEIPNGPAILATGPLTSEKLSEELSKAVGEKFLYFYDAAAPIVSLESIDMSKAYRANRYGETGDYINCPMNEAEYRAFWAELVNAETAQKHEFEKEAKHFEGCLPVEVIAKRGEQTLLFGPLRPVGLEMPNGKRPFAVVQLRQDNAEGTLYNMVGFQTSLKWGEQERVFRMIPALAKAEFVRKGVMHRNLFVRAPSVLDRYLRLKGRENLFLAGQMTGVEGYLESAATGFAAAMFLTAYFKNLLMPDFPRETMLGSLLNYLHSAVSESFQPMNANLGIMPKLLGKKIRKRAERCEAYAERSTLAISEFIAQNETLFSRLIEG